MWKVKVVNLKVYAYHGCLKEETIIGSEYLVNIVAHGDTELSSKSDSIKDSMDYVMLCNIAKDEMNKTSNLLETVVYRIANRCLSEISLIEKIKVCLAKINPPINANVQNVSVCITKKRNN